MNLLNLLRCDRRITELFRGFGRRRRPTILLGLLLLCFLLPPKAIAQLPPPTPRPTPSADEAEAEDEDFEDEDFEDNFEDDGDAFFPSSTPFEVDGELNPLAVPDLDEVLRTRINEESWEAMKGQLSCVAATPDCISELQETAVSESRVLREISDRVDEARELISQARNDNKKAVRLATLTPILQYYLTTDRPASMVDVDRSREEYNFDRSEFERQQALASALRRQQGFNEEIDQLSRANFRPYQAPINPLARFLSDISSPVRLFGNLLNLVGVNVIQSIFGGGTPAQQQRSIEISSLEIRVTELERGGIEAAQRLREAVAAQVLICDSAIADFQNQQVLRNLDQQRLLIAEIEYRNGVQNGYQAQRGTYHRQQASTTKSWNDLRLQMHRLHLLVFSALD